MDNAETTKARAAAETAARASYGRLVAILTARTGNIAAAEDALADAFASALKDWPVSGVPKSPEAWLLTSAKHRLIDVSRRDATAANAKPVVEQLIDEAQDMVRPEDAQFSFPDERLKLMFICAHPAIAEPVRTPLMLQTVLGIDAARIANAFLISPKAMGQRLVRAKNKISKAKIPFLTPREHEIDARLHDVIDAIYVALTAGYNAQGEAELVEEAIFLSQLVTTLAPDFAEGHGLYALSLYTHSRRDARIVDGRYIPFSDQDVTLWDNDAIARAEKTLMLAARLQNPGRFQIEAAIQSAQIAQQRHKINTTADVLSLYDQLIAIAPSIGALVGKAGCLFQVGNARDAIFSLDKCDPATIADYQPYWAVRAHALLAIGQYRDADEAFSKAISLSESPAERRYLIEQRTRALN